jgi:hypothetical protein
VGDQQRGLGLALEGLRKFALEHHPGLRVDRRERLVEQQHGRIGRERAGQRDPLPHAARQLMRIVPGEIEKMEVFQQRLRAPLALRQREPLDFDAEHHVLEHGAPGQQQVLLQHEGDVRVRAFHALAVDEGLTFARRAETRTDVEEGRFSATAGTDERDHLAVTD